MNEETFKKLYIDYYGITEQEYLQDIFRKEHTFPRMAALYEFLGFFFSTDTEEEEGEEYCVTISVKGEKYTYYIYQL